LQQVNVTRYAFPFTILCYNDPTIQQILKISMYISLKRSSSAGGGSFVLLDVYRNLDKFSKDTGPTKTMKIPSTKWVTVSIKLGFKTTRLQGNL
jgi:hypothetical protein